MVGRNVQLTVDRGESHPGDPVLSVSDLQAKDDRGREVVRGVDFEVRAGEILGIAGVAGNGQDELVEALTGLRKPTAGSVVMAGQDVTGWGPRPLYEAGLAHVPGDRHRWAMIEGLPAGGQPRPHQLLQAAVRPRPRPPGWRDRRHWAQELIEQYDIRTPSTIVTIDTLSGGNQQKAVVAREFSGVTKLLVLDQPTRGLDVGSIEFIHRRAIEMRDAGTAILLVSAELDEVLELSDRIAVMYPRRAGRHPRRSHGEQGRGRPAHGHRRSRGRSERGRVVTDVKAPPTQPFWRRGRLGQVFNIAAVPVASVFLALVVAGLIILASSVVTTGSIDWTLPFVAYAALLQGSFGSESAILNTILQATPLVLGGLAVGIGFKAGLFNIGGHGQFLLAATAAAGVGAALATAPAPIAITAALVAGIGGRGRLGLHPGRTEGLFRSARGRHDDHAQLHRRRAGRVPDPRDHCWPRGSRSAGRAT